MMVAAPINLISLDDRGIAYISGTRMKVAQIARERRDFGYNPEEIFEAHLHLTLAQIHAALSYYYCHQDEIDTYIHEQDAYYEDFCRRNPHVVTREELEARRDRMVQAGSNAANAGSRVAEAGAQYGSDTPPASHTD